LKDPIEGRKYPLRGPPIQRCSLPTNHYWIETQTHLLEIKVVDMLIPPSKTSKRKEISPQKIGTLEDRHQAFLQTR